MPVKNKNRQSNSGFKGTITGLDENEKNILKKELNLTNSDLFRHFVRLKGTDSTNNITYYFNFTLISNSKVSLDSLTDINNYVPKDTSDNFSITITGYVWCYTGICLPTYVINSSYSMSVLKYAISDGSVTSSMVSIDLSAATISDDITTIANGAAL